MTPVSLPALLALALAGTVWPASAEPRAVPLERLLHGDRTTVLVAAHRACWQKASENALDGIRACIADGIDMVEVDVRTTRDGALVLMHDETVDRTTNGHGAVAALTLADIRRLVLRQRGGGASEPLSRRRVPTLAEALAVARGRVLVNIDVKMAALDRIIDAVAAADANAYVLLNVPIDCDAATVARARALGIAIQPVYSARGPGVAAPVAIGRAAALEPASIQLIFDDPAVLDRASQAAGAARLFVNTMTYDIATGRPMNLSGPFVDAKAIVDPASVWGRLIGEGVTIIQTDRPWELRRWLQKRRR